MYTVCWRRSTEACEHCWWGGEHQLDPKETGDFEAAGHPDPPGHRQHQQRHPCLRIDQATDCAEEPVCKCPHRRGAGEFTKPNLIFVDQVSLAPPSNPGCPRSSSCDERLKSPAPRPLSHAVKSSLILNRFFDPKQDRQRNTENLAVSNRSFPLSGIRYHLKYENITKEYLFFKRSPTSKTRNNLVSAPR